MIYQPPATEFQNSDSTLPCVLLFRPTDHTLNACFHQLEICGLQTNVKKTMPQLYLPLEDKIVTPKMALYLYSYHDHYCFMSVRSKCNCWLSSLYYVIGLYISGCYYNSKTKYTPSGLWHLFYPLSICKRALITTITRMSLFNHFPLIAYPFLLHSKCPL